MLSLVNSSSSSSFVSKAISEEGSGNSILPETGTLIKFIEKDNYIEVYDIPQMTRKKIPTSVQFHDCSAIYQIGNSIYVAGGEDASTQELQDDLFEVSVNGECSVL